MVHIFFNLANCSEMGSKWLLNISKMTCKYFWNIIEFFFYFQLSNYFEQFQRGKQLRWRAYIYFRTLYFRTPAYILLKFENVFGIFTLNIFNQLSNSKCFQGETNYEKEPTKAAANQRTPSTTMVSKVSKPFWTVEGLRPPVLKKTIPN